MTIFFFSAYTKVCKRRKMKKICFAITGAIFEIEKAKNVVEKLCKDFDVTVVFSEFVCQNAKEKINDFEKITNHKVLTKITEVESICPNNLSEALVIYPCTGNTLGMIASSISNSVVSFLAKAHARNYRPIVLGISTNDGLGLNLFNIAKLINMKEVYFVPFGQDNYKKKPKSIVCDCNLVEKTLKKALSHEQLQPILLGAKNV